MASFEGPTLPDWARRRLADGLGSVCLFGSNIESPAQLGELTAAIHAAGSDVLTATDEEGGDVTRLHRRRGSPHPGNAALGAVDDVALTEQVAGGDRRRARRGRHRPRPRTGGRREQQPRQPGDRRAQLRCRPAPRRAAHHGVRRGAAGRRGRCVRQALARSRRHRGRLPPRPPGRDGVDGRPAATRAGAVRGSGEGRRGSGDDLARAAAGARPGVAGDAEPAGASTCCGATSASPGCW